MKLVSELRNFLLQLPVFKSCSAQPLLLGLKLLYSLLACLQLLLQFNNFGLQLRIAIGNLLGPGGRFAEPGQARRELVFKGCGLLLKLLVRFVQLLILGLCIAQALLYRLKVIDCPFACRKLA